MDELPLALGERCAPAANSPRVDRLTEEEKRRILQVLEELSRIPPERSRAEVDAELAEIRESRRTFFRS